MLMTCLSLLTSSKLSGEQTDWMNCLATSAFWRIGLLDVVESQELLTSGADWGSIMGGGGGLKPPGETK